MLKLTNRQIRQNKDERMQRTERLQNTKRKAEVNRFYGECDKRFKPGKTYRCPEINTVIKVGELLPAMHGRFFEIVQRPNIEQYRELNALPFDERDETLWYKMCLYFGCSFNTNNGHDIIFLRQSIIVSYSEYFTDRYSGYEEVPEGV